MVVGLEEVQSEPLWSPDRFKEEISRASRKHSIPMRRLPPQVDIGREYSDLGRGMLDRSLKDNLKRERLRTAKVTYNGEIVVDRDDFVANEKEPLKMKSEWRFGIKDPYRDPRYRQTELPAFAIHTHPLEYPPSPIDISALVLEEGEEADLIFAPEVNYLLLKTLETPQYNGNQTRSLGKKWENMVIERYTSIGVRPSYGSKIYYEALAGKAGWAAVRDITRKYKIAVYTSFKDSSVFTRSQI